MRPAILFMKISINCNLWCHYRVSLYEALRQRFLAVQKSPKTAKRFWRTNIEMNANKNNSRVTTCRAYRPKQPHATIFVVCSFVGNSHWCQDQEILSMMKKSCARSKREHITMKHARSNNDLVRTHSFRSYRVLLRQTNKQLAGTKLFSLNHVSVPHVTVIANDPVGARNRKRIKTRQHPHNPTTSSVHAREDLVHVKFDTAHGVSTSNNPRMFRLHSLHVPPPLSSEYLHVTTWSLWDFYQITFKSCAFSKRRSGELTTGSWSKCTQKLLTRYITWFCCIFIYF